VFNKEEIKYQVVLSFLVATAAKQSKSSFNNNRTLTTYAVRHYQKCPNDMG